MPIRTGIIKVIQIRVEHERDGKITGWNTKFQKAGAAAKHWACWANDEWRKKKFPTDYHEMTEVDWVHYRAREKTLIRRAVPVFQRMLDA